MKQKRRIALMMAVMLLLTAILGCQNNNQQGVNNQGKNGQKSGQQTDEEMEQYQGKGRFMESELELPEEIDWIVTAEKLVDGTLAVVGINSQMETYYLLQSQDEGSTWNTVKVDNMQQKYISLAAIAPDGKVAFVGFFEGSDAMDIKLANTDGSVTAVNLSLPELAGADAKNQIIQAKYGENGELLILDFTNKIYRIDVQAGSCEALCDTGSEEMEYFGIAGDTLLAVIPGTDIQLFSVADGSAKENDAVLTELSASHREYVGTMGVLPIIFNAGTEVGSIIYATHEGVFYHSENGSVSELVINGELTSLGDTSTNLASIMQLSEKTYLIHLIDSIGGAKLLKYTYDENASAVPEKQLKVYALEDSVVLQQAISLYQKQHPDVFVKKEIGLSGDDGMTVEDALQALSTDILADKGPDVLILDGTPMDSYIEKGILADISEVIEELDSSEGIFSNIKQMYQNDGKIYYLPARFFFSMVEGSAEAVAAGNSLTDLLAYAKNQKQENPEQGILPSTGPKGMLQELMDVDSASWQNEAGEIDKEKLESFLSCVKEMYELDEYDEEQRYDRAYEKSDFNKGQKYGTLNTSAVGHLYGTFQIAFGTMGSFGDCADLQAVVNKQSETFGLLNGQDNKTLQPYLMAGVAENSNDKEGAFGFLRTLLGSECESISGNGFPINRTAFETQRANQNEYSVASSGANGEVLSLEMKKMTDEEYDQLIKTVESLEKPALTNRIIRELVMNEGIKYLNGETTLDNAVTTIMQKVNLYLSE